MPELIIILSFLIRTQQGVQVEDLAIVKDMETCQTLAALINEKVKDDPNAGAVCRRGKPPEKA